MSGPLRGQAKAQTAATVTAPARARPRRRPVSEHPAGPPLLERSAAFVRALPDHSLLDRIVRGRAWIPLIGLLLAGIVAMQVEVLKLNAGIGRSLVRGTALQSENALLRTQVATLADDQRIESRAAQLGMVMPSANSIKFLSLDGTGAVRRALTSYRQPNPTTFSSGLTASGIGASSSAAAPSAPASTAPAFTAAASTAPAFTAAASTAGAAAASAPPASSAATAAPAPTNTTNGASTGTVAP